MCQKAAEEDGDHTDDPEESEIGVVDHAQPPQLGLHVLRSTRRGLPVAYMAARSPLVTAALFSSPQFKNSGLTY
jgi:hypothetical protein